MRCERGACVRAWSGISCVARKGPGQYMAMGRRQSPNLCAQLRAACVLGARSVPPACEVGIPTETLTSLRHEFTRRALGSAHAQLALPVADNEIRDNFAWMATHSPGATIRAREKGVREINCTPPA